MCISPPPPLLLSLLFHSLRSLSSLSSFSSSHSSIPSSLLLSLPLILLSFLLYPPLSLLPFFIRLPVSPFPYYFHLSSPFNYLNTLPSSLSPRVSSIDSSSIPFPFAFIPLSQKELQGTYASLLTGPEHFKSHVRGCNHFRFTAWCLEYQQRNIYASRLSGKRKRVERE